jgi:hypothetical protein
MHEITRNVVSKFIPKDLVVLIRIPEAVVDAWNVTPTWWYNLHSEVWPISCSYIHLEKSTWNYLNN